MGPHVSLRLFYEVGSLNVGFKAWQVQTNVSSWIPWSWVGPHVSDPRGTGVPEIIVRVIVSYSWRIWGTLWL